MNIFKKLSGLALLGILVSSCTKKPEACFSSPTSNISTGNDIVFVNCSQNAETYVWNFGDESQLSTEESPTHSFSKAGTYEVSLTATNEDKSDVFSFTFKVSHTTAIGDNFEGGKIFYIFNENDPGYVTGEVHGLIAAINDQPSEVWGPNNTLVGNTHITLGSGLANTNTIIASIGNEGNSSSVCGNLVLNGFSDWYLPSLQELNKLFLNKDVVGNFLPNHLYQTSSEYNSGNAWKVNMTTGKQEIVGAGSKTVPYQIRAIRTF